MKRGVRSRLIVKLTLCTLAGAVVTWGVAWGCAWVRLGVLTTTKQTLVDAQAIRAAEEFGIPSKPPFTHCLLTLSEGSGFGLTYRAAELQRWSPPSFEGVAMTYQSDGLVYARESSSGWPFIAMTYWVSNRERVPKGGVFIGAEVMPLRILPLGFALNTLIAAALLRGIKEIVDLARRRRRARKGRCAECGYDRGGLANDAACPECGDAASG